MGGGRNDAIDGRQSFTDKRSHIFEVMARDEYEKIVGSRHEEKGFHILESADSRGD